MALYIGDVLDIGETASRLADKTTEHLQSKLSAFPEAQHFDLLHNAHARILLSEINHCNG